MNVMETLEYYKKSLEQDGYRVLYIGLYGSNNYGVDDEYSDVDAKVIVLPSLDDIVFKKTVSFVREFENGACDVKDLVTYYNVVKKGNFSFVEPFYSKYYLGDEFLRDLFKQVPTNLLSVLGGMYEKQKALTHEYPSKTKEFELFNCDPKQYHHIVRLYDMAMRKTTLPFLTYTGKNAEYMKSLKRGMNGKTVEFLIEDSQRRINEVKELFKDLPKYQEVNFDTEVLTYLKEKMKEDLLNE